MLRRLPLGLAAFCEQNGGGCGPDCRSGCLSLFCTSRPREAEALYLDGERHNQIVHDASLVTGFTEAGIRSDPGRRCRAIHMDQKAYGGGPLSSSSSCSFSSSSSSLELESETVEGSVNPVGNFKRQHKHQRIDFLGASHRNRVSERRKFLLQAISDLTQRFKKHYNSTLPPIFYLKISCFTTAACVAGRHVDF